jgi:pyridoxine 5-phosphate synthase
MTPVLAPMVQQLRAAGIRISLFIAADSAQIDSSVALGADIVELHTGSYAEGNTGELAKLQNAATYAASKGLEVHAGHGLSYANVAPIAALPEVVELNIGHFLIGQAIFSGLESSIRDMRQAMDSARKNA